MKLVFIQVGGTIDKEYPKLTKGYNFEIGTPACSRVLEKIAPNFQYEVVPLLQKDSLDLTDNDRESILLTCQKTACDKIIITHGTDTMIETASKLSCVKDKTVVITGAMRPERFSDSDAMFNVGTAVTAAQILPYGIYIAMNGRIYPWDKVKRNMETGQFTSL